MIQSTSTVKYDFFTTNVLYFNHSFTDADATDLSHNRLTLLSPPFYRCNRFITQPTYFTSTTLLYRRDRLITQPTYFTSTTLLPTRPIYHTTDLLYFNHPPLPTRPTYHTTNLLYFDHPPLNENYPPLNDNDNLIKTVSKLYARGNDTRSLGRRLCC